VCGGGARLGAVFGLSEAKAKTSAKRSFRVLKNKVSVFGLANL